ncbi:MAG: arsenate reductase ArsC [Alphaproteobacteria bacterium]|nr:arsenate reductase ArsC [Alphaproteobacteria bacterium]
MPVSTQNMLFLCTGNSARSILAEMYMNHSAQGRFRAFSAGSIPKGEVHPLSLETLRAAGIPITGARSKSWDEFAVPGAPRMDIVITVCDNAAAESCPIWPGAPVKAHWSFPDPAAAQGSEAERRKAFIEIFADIRQAIDRLIALPAGTSNLAERISEIGPA